MKKFGRTILLIALLGAALTIPAEAGWINRLSVDFFNWGGGESATSSAIPGVVIFQKSIFVPDETAIDFHWPYFFLTDPLDQVMNIEFKATGDVHGSGAMLIGCFINGVPCHPGFTFSAGGPASAGFVNVMRVPQAPCGGSPLAGDCHDNNIKYDWCVPSARFSSNAFNTVQIRLAVIPAATAFIEAAQVEIDTSTIEAPANSPGGPINPCIQLGPAAPELPGH